MALGASALFILDSRGKVIISRDYRGDVPMGIANRFVANVIDKDETEIRPVFNEDRISYCWIKHNDVYLLATCTQNTNAMMLITFLYRLVEVIETYFNKLEEESIRDNFVVTYELLDEVMDHGFPQTTETKVLREYIKNQAFQLIPRNEKPTVPPCLTGSVSWRADNIKHKKNEIFLDVIERVNLLVAKNGDILLNEVQGVLLMKSYLSGMPELRLGLNEKALEVVHGEDGENPTLRVGGKSVELEDIRFHQCVRLKQFQENRSIVFIPPDGEFELMRYRISNAQIGRPLIGVSCHIDWQTARVDFDVMVISSFKARSVANNVEILIPVPSDVDRPHFKTNIGSAKYAPDRQCMIWAIRQLQGQREYSLTATFGLPSVAEESRGDFTKRPIVVNFEIPYLTVSGILVRYLKIVEKSCYQALPWVRYITQSGDYQIRMR